MACGIQRPCSISFSPQVQVGQRPVSWGGIANPILFNGGVINGWTFWFATEFVNYVAILPVILSAPAWSAVRQRLQASPTLRVVDIPPAAALAASFLAAAMVAGPGAAEKNSPQ